MSHLIETMDPKKRDAEASAISLLGGKVAGVADFGPLVGWNVAHKLEFCPHERGVGL